MEVSRPLKTLEQGQFLEKEIGFTELKDLVQTLKNNYGIDFSNYAKSSLIRRIKRVLTIFGIENYDQLKANLSSNELFFKDFINEITVNTTELFRDPSLWRYLRKDVIPQLNVDHNLAIWHAGCSSGEEVLSLSIILNELGLLGKIRVVATDLNSDVLEEAKKGRMNVRKLDLYRENYKRYSGSEKLNDHCVVRGEYAYFDPELLKHVQWRKHNLVKSEVFSKFDLILCRNVLIYFDAILQNNVFELFHESLFKNGKLILGSKESMITSPVYHKFKEINRDEKVYEKL